MKFAGIMLLVELLLFFWSGYLLRLGCRAERSATQKLERAEQFYRESLECARNAGSKRITVSIAADLTEFRRAMEHAHRAIGRARWN